MDVNIISFEDLPRAVAHLVSELAEIKSLVEKGQTPIVPAKRIPIGIRFAGTIGVATSKEPAANFTVQGYIEGMDPLIDPCVFIDDDGQAYIYQGGGHICKGGKLKNNMMELDGELQVMEGLVDFHKAAWVHKYNGRYYLSYSDNHDKNWNDGVMGNNRMRYAISDNPLGAWKHMGIYMEPTDSYTNHGSIVEYKGQWLAFYHNSALSNHD